MKLVWVTDIHLDHVRSHFNRESFYDKVGEAGEQVIITGDIASGRSFAPLLIEMAERIKKPINFVLGNHDFYHSSIKASLKAAAELSIANANLIYLPIESCYFGGATWLCGADGWADGGYGDYTKSPVSLNDQYLIDEFLAACCKNRAELLKAMQHQANRDAKLLEAKIMNLIHDGEADKIIIATHVPPFPENALYEGKVSNDDFLPFFASKMTGDVLLEAARKFPDLKIMVLCGHSHHEAVNHPQANLLVYTGKAEYGVPGIAGIIDTDSFEMECV